MPISREVKEGLLFQGADEKVAYTITTTPWGSSPSSVTFKAYNDVTNSDVTSTVYPSGSATANGDVITLPLLQALTAKSYYRIEIKFDSGGNTFELFFRVFCDG